MDDIETIIERQQVFQQELLKDHSFDDVLIGFVASIGRDIAEQTETIDEAVEMGKLIATALVASAEAAAKDQHLP